MLQAEEAGFGSMPLLLHYRCSLVGTFFHKRRVGEIDYCIEATGCGSPATPPVGVLRGVDSGAARRFRLVGLDLT
jgi:hypothetical protein